MGCSLVTVISAALTYHLACFIILTSAGTNSGNQPEAKHPQKVPDIHEEGRNAKKAEPCCAAAEGKCTTKDEPQLAPTAQEQGSKEEAEGPTGSHDSLAEQLPEMKTATTGCAHRVLPKSDASMTGQDFLTNHVLRQRPLLVAGTINGSKAIPVWSHDYWNSMPHSLTTWVRVKMQHHLKPEARGMTFKEFLRVASNDNAESNIFLNDDIPAFLQKDILLPRLLLCEDLSRQLTTHSLHVSYRKHTTPFVQSEEESLLCIVSGRVDIELIEAGSSLQGTPLPTDHNMVPNEGVDNQQKNRQQLKGKLVSGDCIYIPSTWSHSLTVRGPLTAVGFQWETLTNQNNAITCGNDSQNWTSVADFSKKFTNSRLQRRPEDDALLHYFLFYLGDGLKSSFVEKQFMRKLKQDKTILSKLHSWDDECEDIAKELFEVLDVNSDGIFSSNDVNMLEEESISGVVAHIRDRLIDFNEVITEQKKQAARKAINNAMPDLGQLQEELQSRLLNELSKLIEPDMDEIATDQKNGATAQEDNRKRQNEDSNQKNTESKQKNGASDTPKTETPDIYEVVDNDEVLEIVADDENDNLEEIEVSIEPSAAPKKSASAPTLDTTHSKAGGDKTQKQEL